MDIVHIEECRYGIKEQEEVPVRYTGIYQPFRVLPLPDAEEMRSRMLTH
jgi:hypothetical protein